MVSLKRKRVLMNAVEIADIRGIFLHIPVYFILNKGRLVPVKKVLVLKDIKKGIRYYSLDNKACPFCGFPYGIVCLFKEYTFWMCLGEQCMSNNFNKGIKKPLVNISTYQRHRMTDKDNHFFIGKTDPDQG